MLNLVEAKKIGGNRWGKQLKKAKEGPATLSLKSIPRRPKNSKGFYERLSLHTLLNVCQYTRTILTPFEGDPLGP
jgi:hypothetical protein